MIFNAHHQDGEKCIDSICTKKRSLYHEKWLPGLLLVTGRDCSNKTLYLKRITGYAKNPSLYNSMYLLNLIVVHNKTTIHHHNHYNHNLQFSDHTTLSIYSKWSTNVTKLVSKTMQTCYEQWHMDVLPIDEIKVRQIPKCWIQHIYTTC